MWTALFYLFCIGLAISLARFLYFSSRFPPGLPRLPLVGTVPFLKGQNGTKIIMSSVKLIPKYGKLIGYYIGPAR